MKQKSIHICLSLFWLICIQGIHISAQEPVHTRLQDQVRTQVHDGVYTLVDFVELKLEKQTVEEDLCGMEFLEEWTILPREHTLRKQVLDQDSSCMARLMILPEKKGLIPIRNISYEFHLLDPHLIASGNEAFSEPDSMDQSTRRLQGDLIALISELSHAEDRYPLEDQLLSVIFHEDWSLDPRSGEITKKVRGISPVVWQRRQTVNGDPVNDGETGLPVYYKNELDQIDLRNP